MFTPILGIDILAGTPALEAHRLDLLEHARPDLADLHLHAASLADPARRHGALLATPAFALITDYVLLQRQFSHCALGNKHNYILDTGKSTGKFVKLSS